MVADESCDRGRPISASEPIHRSVGGASDMERQSTRVLHHGDHAEVVERDEPSQFDAATMSAR
jgi:hypothetical protein